MVKAIGKEKSIDTEVSWKTIFIVELFFSMIIILPFATFPSSVCHGCGCVCSQKKNDFMLAT